MKSKKRRILNLAIASVIFLVTFFSYNSVQAFDEECYICVQGGPYAWCDDTNGAGFSSCTIWLDGEGNPIDCDLTGQTCYCPDPTVPCEA